MIILTFTFLQEYKSPKWISSEVRDLIRKILETDPKRRYTLEDIRQHSWYRMVDENQVPKDIVPVAEYEASRSDALQAVKGTPSYLCP